MRRYIRHPASIPIEVVHETQLTRRRARIDNISYGGLAFDSSEQFEPGSIVSLRVPMLSCDFIAPAKVIWCTSKQHIFGVGVAFFDPMDAYQIRMMEQICHIETYRQRLFREQGRVLSPEQAAHEWIEKFARHFPDPGAGKTH